MGIFSVLPSRAEVLREEREEAVARSSRQAKQQNLDAAVSATGPVSPGHLRPLHQVFDLAADRQNTLAVAARCDAGIKAHPAFPMYTEMKAACAARLEWITAQENAAKNVESARAAVDTAAAEVERLQATVTDLEVKLNLRRERQANTLAQVAKALADVGAAEADGGSTTEARKRLTSVQQDSQVDEATINTLTARLREPAAALAESRTRLADAESARTSAEKALRDQQLRTLAGAVIEMIAEGTDGPAEQSIVRRHLEWHWSRR